MIVTAFTSGALRVRRQARRLKALGYEEVNDRGGMLWELNRGCRQGMKITDAIVSESGLSVWVKVEKRK